MKFFRPIGNKDTASSRLRVFNIVPHLKNAFVGIADEYRKGDTLVIQKVPDINELRKAKSQGARVIYDIDDFYWKEENFAQMIKEADLVTVDTDEKKRMLALDFKDKEVVVIPDSLDWDGTVRKDFEKGILGWTGYGNNSHYLNDIIPKLPKEFQLRLITSPDWINYVQGNPQNVHSRPWSLDMVDKYLAECEMGVIYFPSGDFENCKGMHRLLKNWAIGLPTITSPMPDYVKAMEEAGVGHKYLLHHWDMLKPVEFDEKCREYAYKFKAEEVAKQWEKVLQ